MEKPEPDEDAINDLFEEQARRIQIIDGMKPAACSL
jgi:hypothetical protein